MNEGNPRQIAARVLARRETGPEFTEALLDAELARARPGPADRGLCVELVCGVVRWQATLDWLVARRTAGRPQRPALQQLLRLGLYQLFWLDRIPAHAAVHETVELARGGGHAAQAGFINAILRGCLREADAIRRQLAELKTTQPHLGFSHPAWLVDRWQARWGAERLLRLLEWNNRPPKVHARVNRLKAGAPGATHPAAAAALGRRWQEEGVQATACVRDWTGEDLIWELTSPPPLASLGSFRDGWFYVQDPGTLLAAQQLGACPGETILDLCAAPGGKTSLLAQDMRNEGRLLAADVSPARLELVRQNCERLGITCVSPTLLAEAPSANPHPDLIPGAFDRILLDAPCSNTGVLRRRVDLRWRISVAEIARLQALQAGLLALAAPLLKPGGILVYSTCSLEPEENALQVEQFLAAQPGFTLETSRELMPVTDEVDGAFAARLKKTA